MTQFMQDTGLNNLTFANELPAAEQAQTDNALAAGPPVTKAPNNIKLAAVMFGAGIMLSFFLGPFGILLSGIIFVVLTFAQSQSRREGTKKSGFVKFIVIGFTVVGLIIIGIPLIFLLLCLGGGF